MLHKLSPKSLRKFTRPLLDRSLNKHNLDFKLDQLSQKQEIRDEVKTAQHKEVVSVVSAEEEHIEYGLKSGQQRYQNGDEMPAPRFKSKAPTPQLPQENKNAQLKVCFSKGSTLTMNINDPQVTPSELPAVTRDQPNSKLLDNLKKRSALHILDQLSDNGNSQSKFEVLGRAETINSDDIEMTIGAGNAKYKGSPLTLISYMPGATPKDPRKIAIITPNVQDKNRQNAVASGLSLGDFDYETAEKIMQLHRENMNIDDDNLDIVYQATKDFNSYRQLVNPMKHGQSKRRESVQRNQRTLPKITINSPLFNEEGHRQKFLKTTVDSPVGHVRNLQFDQLLDNMIAEKHIKDWQQVPKSTVGVIDEDQTIKEIRQSSTEVTGSPITYTPRWTKGRREKDNVSSVSNSNLGTHQSLTKGDDERSKPSFLIISPSSLNKTMDSKRPSKQLKQRYTSPFVSNFNIPKQLEPLTVKPSRQAGLWSPKAYPSHNTSSTRIREKRIRVMKNMGRHGSPIKLSTKPSPLELQKEKLKIEHLKYKVKRFTQLHMAETYRSKEQRLAKTTNGNQTVNGQTFGAQTFGHQTIGTNTADSVLEQHEQHQEVQVVNMLANQKQYQDQMGQMSMTQPAAGFKVSKTIAGDLTEDSFEGEHSTSWLQPRDSRLNQSSQSSIEKQRHSFLAEQSKESKRQDKSDLVVTATTFQNRKLSKQSSPKAVKKMLYQAVMLTDTIRRQSKATLQVKGRTMTQEDFKPNSYDRKTPIQKDSKMSFKPVVQQTFIVNPTQSKEQLKGPFTSLKEDIPLPDQEIVLQGQRYIKYTKPSIHKTDFILSKDLHIKPFATKRVSEAALPTKTKQQTLSSMSPRTPQTNQIVESPRTIKHQDQSQMSQSIKNKRLSSQARQASNLTQGLAKHTFSQEHGINDVETSYLRNSVTNLTDESPFRTVFHRKAAVAQAEFPPVQSPATTSKHPDAKF